MLSQLAARLPTGRQWLYEPKFDGFRGLLRRSSDGVVRLTSRQGKDLTGWFPELAQAGKSLPPSTVLDGEIVIADEHGQADFGALQSRLGVRSRRSWQAAVKCPAILLVFDVLERAGADLVNLPLSERRRNLEELLEGLHPCLQLILQTSDPLLAKEWLGEVPGLEGIVAKQADGRYRPGRREWIKVKRIRTADCVVVGVAGEESAPMLVLALRHTDGELRHCGLTRPVPRVLSEPIAQLLKRAGPLERPIRSRWHRQEIAHWRRVPAEAVCEVKFSNVDASRRFRYATTLLRWRPDLSPQDCRVDQLMLA
jgi:ATP-dependent DNA ligase